MRLTVKRENLIRFYSCGVPYTFHDVTHIPKPLHVIFDDVDEYIKKCEGQKYVRLFSPDEKYEKMFDRIQYLIIQKVVSQMFIYYHTIWKSQSVQIRVYFGKKYSRYTHYSDTY